MQPIDHLFRGARLDPAAVAIEFGEESITYAELVRRVEALAAAFQAIDPRPQSRVGVSGYNTPEHVIAMLAAFAAGKVWVPLNPLNGRAELDAFIAATTPSIIVADANCMDRFTPGSATVILGRGAGDGDDSIANLLQRHDAEDLDRPDLGPEDLVGIKFTGGSTGRPKGVMQSLRCVNTVVATQLLSIGFDSTSRHLLASPITHGTGTYILPTLSQGGRLVIIERARASDILDAFEHRGVTGVFLPPTVIYNILAEDGVAERTYPALRHLIYAGAPMRPEQIRAAQRAFGPVIETSFGQTEAPQIITYQRAREFAEEANLASVGRASALTRVEIMAPDGRILPAGEEGEIVVKGDIVMKGYLDQPEETAKTIVNGWLHTGDIGVIDSRGYLFIKGRSREVIISGGFNVYPADVEGALGRHASVKECVVFGVEDAKWGERVEAAVELHDGATATAEALTAFVRELLGPIKTPKAIHILDQLPRSPVGKVLRRETKAIVHGTSKDQRRAERRA
ncbi:MAG: AMP-binding protein [Alphaproteobacteria bacterium]